MAQEALENYGLKPARVLEVSDNEAIARVVAAGLGAEVVSLAVAADQRALGRLSRINIADVEIVRQLTPLSLPGRQPGPATAAFDRLLDEG